MKEKHFYDFGAFRIDAGDRVLLLDGEIVPLTQKAFDVLFILIERRDRIVTKGELMNEVWPDTFVEEGSLSQNIYTLRKILGETPEGDDYIKTVPRRGYRFVATVHETWEGASSKEIPTGELRLLIDRKKEKLSDLFQLSPGVDVAENSPPDSFAEERIVAGPSVVAEPGEPADRSPSPIARMKRRSRAMAFSACALLVVLFGIAGWMLFRPTASPEPLPQMSITNLTNTGNISSVAISPDGGYVAYGVMDSPLRSSLWITQLATSTSLQIIPPAELQYYLLTFTPDGKYIYYVTRPEPALYRVSILGGPSKKLLDGVERGVSFSPDGSQFVFRRHIVDRRQVGLFVANADGSEVKEVATIDYPEGLEYPAWSPDGKWIACAAGHSWGGQNMYVVAMRVGEGRLRPVSTRKWRWIGQVEWLADSSGLVMVASDEPSAPRQVWHLSYPGGATRRVTNDSATYVRMSLSAGGRALVALQQSRVTNVWLMPAHDLSRARQITFGAGGYRGRLSWTPDGKMVYESEVGEAATISIMDADGSRPKNLLGDLTGRVTTGLGTVTPDGRSIVYFSDLDGGVRHIWRMGIDGGNPIQLTHGTGEDHPTCSPDGRWVIYTKLETKGGKRPTLWKVSIDGGTPVQVTDEYTSRPSVSPDGKMIASLYTESGSREAKLAIFPFEGGPAVKAFPQPPGGTVYVAWAPDGRGLVYAENPDDDVSTLWVQPLDGGSPRQLARFENDRIFGFDWSRDGKQLACVRGLMVTNAVLIKDFKVTE
jgi:Tol biopolymer transport system component/DNA-binding winged helix-turn-helix (wHTH) protein